EDVLELMLLLAPAKKGQPVRAVPGAGTEVPIWILGSSTFGAELAAALGLPYAFASHFAPDSLFDALDIYRSQFKANVVRETNTEREGESSKHKVQTAEFRQPHAMVG